MIARVSEGAKAGRGLIFQRVFDKAEGEVEAKPVDKFLPKGLRRAARAYSATALSG